jgi:hypothetical protein
MAGRTGNEFTRATRERIAKRAGTHCSRPDCSAPTTAAAEHPRGVRDIGVAAHIAGAAPGSARFDSTMPSHERRSETNGIWLCQNHAKEVDDDPQSFTVELLRRWKAEREMAAANALGRGHRAVPPAGDASLRLRLLEVEDEIRGEELRSRPVRITYVAKMWPGSRGRYRKTMPGGTQELSLEVGESADVPAEIASVLKADFGDAFEMHDGNLPPVPTDRSRPFMTREAMAQLRAERDRLRRVLLGEAS